MVVKHGRLVLRSVIFLLHKGLSLLSIFDIILFTISAIFLKYPICSVSCFYSAPALRSRSGAESSDHNSDGDAGDDRDAQKLP